VPDTPVLIDGSEFCAVYSLKDKRWLTFLDMFPDMMSSVSNKFFAFKNGNIYALDSTDYNTYFGTEYDSKVSATFGFNDSMMKVYNSFSIEGDKTADVTFDNSSGVANDFSSSVLATDFLDVEGYKYISIPRNSLYSEAKNAVSLGEVDVVNASGIITFDHIISNIPFRIGGIVGRVRAGVYTESVLTVLSIDSRRQIRLSANPTSFLTAGDIVVVKEPNDVSGEEARDILLNFTATFEPTEYFEVTAFNAIYETSELHNEQVNQQA
jgi:hypothetical protein